MAPDDKLLPPDGDDNEASPVDNEAECDPRCRPTYETAKKISEATGGDVSVSEVYGPSRKRGDDYYKRIAEDARAFNEHLDALLNIHLGRDGSREFEQLVGEIVSQRRGWELLPHSDEIRRMQSAVRDLVDLARLGDRAVNDDFEAQIALQHAAAEATRTLVTQPHLTEIERRRMQLLDEIDLVRSGLNAWLADTGLTEQTSEFNEIVLQYAREIRRCDPRMTTGEETIVQALWQVYKSRTAPARTAAYFTYAVDMFEDRDKFRCDECWETTHRCSACQQREPGDPVSALEKRFQQAARKHSS